jgi:hypothetical protein
MLATNVNTRRFNERLRNMCHCPGQNNGDTRQIYCLQQQPHFRRPLLVVASTQNEET